MSEYATLKRRPILFPDSVSSFHDSIFSLKEELKALVADDLQNKDAYVQTAVEIAIDLRSALADWTLTKLVDDDTAWRLRGPAGLCRGLWLRRGRQGCPPGDRVHRQQLHAQDGRPVPPGQAEHRLGP